MRLNLLAGFASSAWSALIMLAVVPLYLKYLGIEAYGLIGFFATTQALLQLLDMGLAPTINREVARASASGNLQDAGKLLHSLAIIYWGMAGVIALLIVALAPLIAGYWLQSKNIPQQTITHAVMLMGLVVACRWPIGLYQGAVMGAQRLAVSSGINMVMVTLGSVGAVVVLAFVSPTIEAFFIWQACIGFVHTITIRWASWRVVGRLKEILFDFGRLKSIWRFSAGMSGITLSAIVFMQLDKIILSKMLGLAEFGSYMLATTVVSGLYVLIMPVFNVIYPRLSELVVTGDTEKLTELYRGGTRMLATVIFPIAMLLVIFSEDLVLVWTRNPTIASSAAPIVSLLAIGSALHGVMFFPYALQVANGMTRLPLIINTFLMIILIPLIIILSMTYGAIGGAMAWLVLHVLYVILGTWMTHRHLLQKVGWQWLVQDVGNPLSLSIFIGLIAYYGIHETEFSSNIKLMCGLTLVLAMLLLSFFWSTQMRAAVLKSLKWKKCSI